MTRVSERDRDLDGRADDLDNEFLWQNQIWMYEELEEIEHHLHNREIWLGAKAVPTATSWADDTLTAFRAISGNGVYGADANDEAEVLGSADTPIQTNYQYFDMRRLLILAASSDTVYKLRISWGITTKAAAISAGQYVEVMVLVDSATPQDSGGGPIEVLMPRIAAGTQVWVECKNATDNATLDFFVGLHEYEE